MLPDRVSNPGPLTYESGALPIALRGPAGIHWCSCFTYVYIEYPLEYMYFHFTVENMWSRYMAVCHIWNCLSHFHVFQM